MTQLWHSCDDRRSHHDDGDTSSQLQTSRPQGWVHRVGLSDGHDQEDDSGGVTIL
jgi:hypothetical protein